MNLVVRSQYRYRQWGEAKASMRFGGNPYDGYTQNQLLINMNKQQALKLRVSMLGVSRL